MEKQSKVCETNKNSKKITTKIKIKGLDIDKAEYQEIVLSNSNHPEYRR